MSRALAELAAIRRQAEELHPSRALTTSSGLSLVAAAGDALPSMDFRNRRRRRADLVLGRTLDGFKFVLTEKGRRLHCHIPGLSNMGKSSLLELMMRQDSLNGQPFILLDVEGSLYERMVAFCATHDLHQWRRIRLLNASDLHHSFGFNPLYLPQGHEVAGVADAALAAVALGFDAIDPEKTPLFMKICRACFGLLAANNLTMCEFPQLLAGPQSRSIREYLLSNITNPIYKWIWDDISERSAREVREDFQSTINRISTFLDTPVVRRIIGQRVDVLKVREAMDQDIILVNLAPNQALGFSAQDARLLGNLILSAVVAAAMERPADVSPPFWVYVDEAFQFIGRDIETMLDRTRKRGVHLTLAHQRLGQLYEKSQSIGDSVIEGGQCKLVFRLVGKSAEEMAYQLYGNTLNLQEPKHLFDKPVVVGYEINPLKSRSTAAGSVNTHTAGTAQTQSQAVTNSRAHTDSENESENWAEGENYSEVDSDTENSVVSRNRGEGTGTSSSHTDSISGIDTGGFFAILPGDGEQAGSADTAGTSATNFSGEGIASGVAHGHASTRGGSSMQGGRRGRGTADTIGEAVTKGSATQTSASDGHAISQTETTGEHETLVPIIRTMPTVPYSLEEQKHRRAMYLANLEERHAIVKIQNKAPVEIIVNEVKPALATRERVSAFVTLVTSSDECTKPMALIEQELAERPMKLIQAAHDFAAARDQARRRPDTDEAFDEQ